MPQPPVESSDQETVYITPPDYRLRKKIGEDVLLRTAFTPEKIKHCQQMINDTLAEFCREMEKQILLIGDSCVNAAQHPEQAETILKKMAELSLTVKKRMESLNFSLGYSVAKSLYEYIQATHVYSDNVLIAVCKHVAVLNNILRDKITGDGGATGQNMLVHLKALNNKLKK